jgi:hypothetical protein
VRVRTTLFVSCDHRNESRYLEMETLSIFINGESKTMVFAQCEKHGGGMGKFMKGFVPNILPDSPSNETTMRGHVF